MSTDASHLAWPLARLGEAIEALARESALPMYQADLKPPPGDLVEPGALRLARWIEGAASWLGLEAEPVEASYTEVDTLLRRCHTAILRLHTAEPRFFAILTSRRNHVVILDPAGKRRKLAIRTIRETLCQPLESPLKSDIDEIIAEAAIEERKRARVRQSILDAWLASTQIRGCWLLRRKPGASFFGALRGAGVSRRFVHLMGYHAAGYCLWLGSWWAIGQGLLEGRLEWSWVWLWAILRLARLPFQLLATRAAGLVAIDGGMLIKQRLLAGAVMLEPNEIRHKGLGQLLGQVIESEVIERLSVSGGLAGAIATIELVIVMALFAATPGLSHMALLLLLVLIAGGILLRRYFVRLGSWTHLRLDMTHLFVEQIIGHRTRLAQEQRSHWHRYEDSALERYLLASQALDRVGIALAASVPRGWSLCACAALIPLCFRPGDVHVSLAIALGGILLAHQALRRLVPGVMKIARAAVAWRQISDLYRAARREERVPPEALPGLSRPVRRQAPFLHAQGLSFRYPGIERTILHGCDIEIGRDEQILLEGPSGSGKSTLGGILAGLQTPNQGLVLLDGLDRRTLGMEGWRRRVATAPQFHENHVFTGSFAFNLLMGRRWPPRPGDLEDAEALCHALELGDLLKRMPAGLMQHVGETGWQLSHGERSRLYLARVLLQNVDLAILDESFAALDPETLQSVLRHVLDRSSALIVIAHP